MSQRRSHCIVISHQAAVLDQGLQTGKHHVGKGLSLGAAEGPAELLEGGGERELEEIAAELVTLLFALELDARLVEGAAWQGAGVVADHGQG